MSHESILNQIENITVQRRMNENRFSQLITNFHGSWLTYKVINALLLFEMYITFYLVVIEISLSPETSTLLFSK